LHYCVNCFLNLSDIKPSVITINTKPSNSDLDFYFLDEKKKLCFIGLIKWKIENNKNNNNCFDFFRQWTNTEKIKEWTKINQKINIADKRKKKCFIKKILCSLHYIFEIWCISENKKKIEFCKVRKNTWKSDKIKK
jgi:hypothetical protein